jgi:hypothetical protein
MPGRLHSQPNPEECALSGKDSVFLMPSLFAGGCESACTVTKDRLSHFLKDRNRFTDRLVDNRMYSSGLANYVEEQADKVALDWLVPGKQLAIIRKEVGYDDVEALARIFRIPVQEMKIRTGQIPRRHRWSEV